MELALFALSRGNSKQMPGGVPIRFANDRGLASYAQQQDSWFVGPATRESTVSQFRLHSRGRCRPLQLDEHEVLWAIGSGSVLLFPSQKSFVVFEDE